MAEKIKNYHEHLTISGWKRIDTNLWYDEDIYMFNVYDDFEDFVDFSEIVKNGNYIYCLELEGNCIKIGYSAELKRRIRTHFKDKNSPFKSKIQRIGILGPIENAKEVEKKLHSDLYEYQDDKYDSLETYHFHKEFNTFDMFMVMFQFIQSSYLLENNTKLINPNINLNA